MKKDWMIKESELDDDQIKVLMETLDKSCIVAGCAGSGKSVLALIKAQRVQKKYGNNYKIIVYTRALCNYMNSGKQKLGLTNDFYYHKEWKYQRERRGGFLVYSRDENGDMIPYMPSADYIIVDEIQDFSDEEIKDFLNATHKNFFFFGDTAQSLYKGLKTTLPVDRISSIVPLNMKVKNWELYRNYRLPLPVARVVQPVGVDLPPFIESTYKSKETAVPRFIRYSSFIEQINSIARILNHGNLSDVGILLPHNDDVRNVSTMLNSLGINHEARYTDKEDWKKSVDTLDFRTSNPKVMTYHSAKGLQFEAVFMPGISPLSDDEGRRISEQKALYVAMTRTYRYLYIMYSGMLPDPLSQVPSNLYLTSEIETVEDI